MAIKILLILVIRKFKKLLNFIYIYQKIVRVLSNHKS